MIRTTGLRRFAALTMALSMAFGPAAGFCQPRDDKPEKAPATPAGKPNKLMKASEKKDEVVFNLKICKGKTVVHTITVNGSPCPGSFGEPESKAIPAVGDPPSIKPDGGQGNITIKAGKDTGYSEWSAEFTADRLPTTDDGARAHKRIRLRIWVVNCDMKDGEIPDPDNNDKKKDDNKKDDPKKEDGKKDDGKKDDKKGGDTKEKPKSGTPNKLKTTTGLFIEEFTTPNGVVKVNLPNDLAAGDTISGTVIGIPAGKTPQEIARNEDAITGYVVEVEKQRTPAKEQIGKWLIPATAAVITLALLDPGGHKVSEQEIPVAPTATDPKIKPITDGSPSKPTDYKLPKIGQAGKPLQVTGPFGGDLTNTSVKIGDEACPILAESPRKMIALAPKTPGASEIQVTENGVTAQSRYQNVGLHASIAKPQLLPGEQTTLSLAVQGCDRPVPVRLTNLTPGIIGMTGGETQVVTVDPEQSATVTLTGRARGPFQIEALLNVDNEGLLADEKPGVNPQPAAPTPEEMIEDAFQKALKANETRERSKAEDKKNPASKDAKDARKDADDADSDAKKADKALTPAQRKKLNGDLSDYYKNAAKQNRQFADEDEKKARAARAERDDLRKQAKEEKDPEKKDKLDKEADHQDQKAKDLDQDAKNERDKATDQEAKSKAYAEQAK